MGLSGSKSAKCSLIAIALLCAGSALTAQEAKRAIAIPPPPMGWSSWNSFSNNLDSDIAVAQAKAIVSTGMHKAGYQYINIDEGWWLGKRDDAGNIIVDPKAWPALKPGEQAGDMANIVRYIHSLGLKAGIYTDAGRDGCGTFFPDLGPGYPGEGSEGHYEQDFLQFAKWGFDYVKVDWCGGKKENLDPAVQYAEIARAIAKAVAATGHPLYYSICEWGVDSPFTWAPNVGGAPADIWRTSGDIVAPIVANSPNATRRADFKKMLSNFDQGIHPEAQHSGFYNDPDMMVIGMPGLTDQQNRVHMALWAISGAPLLVGADLTTLTPDTLATLTNPQVLAVDQDPLGLQAVKVSGSQAGLEVWAKRLAAPGDRAVLLLNRLDKDSSIAVDWNQIGLTASSATVKDLFAGKSLGAFESSYSTTVPAADAVLLIVHGTDQPMNHFHPAPPNATATALAGTKDQVFNLTGSLCRAGYVPLQIVYSNLLTSARYAELRVNGQIATRIAFPPTGSAEASVWIEAQLNKSDPASSGPAPAPNVLTFSIPAASELHIVSVSMPQTAACP
jgi:hypothetical protein